MSKLLRALPIVLVLTGCSSDPEVSKSEFPMEMATAGCLWYFQCCDSAERGNLKLQASNQQACITELAGSYALMYQSADAAVWDGKIAIACVDKVKAAATSCPRSFDLASEVANCQMVRAVTPPGDPCTSQWQCTTKFCRQGTCANPLKSGATCVENEPCEAGTKCVNGTCTALQGDGSACKTGAECYSGFCGAGQCTTGSGYFCDGKAL